MSPDTRVQIQHLEAELVVIGGGGSGLAAALTAAEKGLQRIIVLEKRGATGGNTAMATGLFGCESPTQARQRIIADKDVLFKRAMDWARWSRVNPRIFRAFLNKSGDTIRWLEQMGLEFMVIAFFPNQEPRVEHVPQGRGAHLMRVLADKCRESGIRMLVNSQAEKILLNENGSVRGVTANQKEQAMEIRAPRAVIATGGFAGNRELMEKYCPLYYEGFGVRGLLHTGDGLLMAQEAGAATEDFVTLLKEGPRVDLHTWPLKSLERDPLTVWVNKGGNRFADEAIGMHPFEAGNTILMQPDKVMYTLLDTSILQRISEKTPGLAEALQAEAAKERVKISEDWDDISAWTGAEPAALKKSIEEYNDFCHHGYDEIFAKDRRWLMALCQPPYYAIRCHTHILDTIGGIRINERMEVLNRQDEAIHGLYAAGTATSGWEAETYCSDLNGSAFGYAINSGRIAGENAATMISESKQSLKG